VDHLQGRGLCSSIRRIQWGGCVMGRRGLLGHLIRYYEAQCGWVTVVVGSQLGSPIGLPGHHANPAGTQPPVGGAATIGVLSSRMSRVT
jgi:hypothetical protein